MRFFIVRKGMTTLNFYKTTGAKVRSNIILLSMIFLILIKCFLITY